MIKIDNNTLQINGKIFKKYLNSKKINIIVSKLSERINSDFKDKKPFFLLVLNGSIIFGADLLRKINLDCSITTISAKSYGNKMTSSGKVVLGNLSKDLSNKDIVIVEDIIDSGYTMKKIIDEISKIKPASIKIVSLLSKPSRRKVDLHIDYIGIEIPDKFVVGYGLDYAEKGRNLPDIYALNDEN